MQYVFIDFTLLNDFLSIFIFNSLEHFLFAKLNNIKTLNLDLHCSYYDPESQFYEVK